MTLLVFVTFTSEVYPTRIAIDRINKIMNNLVDIRSLRRSNSLVEGGTDGNRFIVRRYCFTLANNERLGS